VGVFVGELVSYDGSEMDINSEIVELTFIPKQKAVYLLVNEQTGCRMAMAKKLPAFKVVAFWHFMQCEI
jgi:hypothetical protein